MSGVNLTVDVLVIGGGPAGSTASTLLAKEGFKVLVVDKSSFPRYKVGESLLPSALTLFKILGVEEKIEKQGYTKKRGAYLRWGDDPKPWAITFGELLGEDGYSYHVERDSFDSLLLEHARESGAEVWENTSIEEVIFEGDRPVAARVTSPNGSATIAFKTIVDCSGNSGYLSTRVFSSRRYLQDAFQNVALWAYWNDAERLPEPYSGSVLTSSVGNGWIWGIPLKNGVQSIGIVLHKDELKRLRKSNSLEDIYEETIAKCSIASSLIKESSGRTEVQSITDYSYTAESFAGPSYFLCGDAACFLDPVLSSGVHLAMYSALVASASITSILRGEVNELEAISFYESAYRRAFTRFAEFLSAFYQQNQDQEGYFWKAQSLTERDFSSKDLKSAFLNLVSGSLDIQEGLDRTSIHQAIKSGVTENLSWRRHGKNVMNVDDGKKSEVERNANMFSAIEGIGAISESDAICGMYAATSPTIGLRRVTLKNSSESDAEVAHG